MLVFYRAIMQLSDLPNRIISCKYNKKMEVRQIKYKNKR